jgi:hypothetical protein
MTCAQRQHNVAVPNETVILMARIVDRTGNPIRRDHVSAMEYSIYELDQFWPHILTLLPGQKAIPLQVERVLWDMPHVDGFWLVDEVGYNFRHVLELGLDGAVSERGRHYEVRYQIASIGGQITVLRFQLRDNCGRRQQAVWFALRCASRLTMGEHEYDRSRTNSIDSQPNPGTT